MSTLSDLKQGETALIVKVRGRGAFRRRIMEMGFIAGKRVTVIRKAPLQDPVEYNIMGYNVSLRNTEASLIEIDMAHTFFDENELRECHWGHGERRHARHKRNHCGCGKADCRHEHHGGGSHSHIPGTEILVAVVGNPNAGKTTLFNYASGSHERVGNYSGVTVDAKEAEIHHNGFKIVLIDLPGTYSVSAYTPEEVYVRNNLLTKIPDIVLNVVDASNLERNLFLTTQLIDMDLKVVMALNMFDELENRGDQLDYGTLARLLGIPAVPTVGSKGRGIKELLDKIVEVFTDADPDFRHIHINYGDRLEKAIHAVQEKLKKPENRPLTDLISSRYLAIKLLENDQYETDRIEQLANKKEILSAAAYERKKVEDFAGDTIETLITDAKYGFINGAIKETLKPGEVAQRHTTEIIDAFFTHKLFGIPIFLALMWLMFQATFTLGNYPVAWIETGVSFLSDLVENHMAAGMLKDLIKDGIIGGIGGVIVFLPNILLLFFFISLMEDTGYMARAVFIMDKIMHRIGLHGKSFIPLLMGFGCTVPAIMATRTLENRNDRMITMLINPFMSCSARLPVYVLFISAFFPENPGTVLFLIYAIGILTAVAIALILKKTLFKIETVPFVMELPPYRIPTRKAILTHMWDKGVQYLKKIGGIILVASIIVWALGYFPLGHDENKVYQKQIAETHDAYNLRVSNTIDPIETKHLIIERDSLIKAIEGNIQMHHQENSYIGQMGKFIEPVIAPLGFDWKMGVSILAGVPGKEIVVSTLAVLISPADDSEQNLVDRLRNERHKSGERLGQLVYTPLSALSFMIFVLLYFPCLGTIAVISRESGSWKWGAFTILYTSGLAYVVSLLFFQIGSLLGF